MRKAAAAAVVGDNHRPSPVCARGIIPPLLPSHPPLLHLLHLPSTSSSTSSTGRFIVLASDGVWDYLDEDAVARMVSEACSGDGSAGDDDAQTATLNIVQKCVPVRPAARASAQQ